MRVGAVLLHYRYWPGVMPTIDALLRQSAPPLQVVVVDNDSGPEARRAIRETFPGVQLIENATNKGYSAGMNTGVAALDLDDLDAILLLTHDCVLAETALERLTARLAEAADVGAVGPLLGWRSDPTKVFSAGGDVDTRKWVIGHRQSPVEVEAWRGRDPEIVDWLDGSCVVLSKPAREAVGELDEQYFLYYEDVDYGLRLRQAGWRVECVPAAVAWQEPGYLSEYLFTKNRLRLVSSHAPRPVVIREVVRGLAQIAKLLVLSKGSHPSRVRAGARSRGTWEFVLGLKTDPARILRYQADEI